MKTLHRNEISSSDEVSLPEQVVRLLVLMLAVAYTYFLLS
jgi:hypothetical protein